MFNLFTKKTVEMSLPKAKTVHGIEVKKVPIGRYTQAMTEIQDLPERIIRDLFPGKSIDQIWAELANLKDDGLISIASRLFVVAPEYIIDISSIILGIDREKIVNELSPAELLDIWQAFWEANDLSRFFQSAAAALKPLLQNPPLTGSRNG